MFELTLSTTIDKQTYLGDCFNLLHQDVKQDAGIIVKQNNNGRAYLALAVDENKKEYYKSKILDYVLFMIIDDYKYNFYKENLISNDDSVVYGSFLKAISIFDADNDKDIIKSQIHLSGEILIDSFFYFKLQLLRARWRRTANIINQNNIVQSNSSMLDILKYLTTISDSGIVKADVGFCKKQITLKTYDGTKRFKNDFKGISNFLAEIVKLNPSRINLKTNDSKEEFGQIKHMLMHIFGEKIYIIN